jgi:hypothetical protein
MSPISPRSSSSTAPATAPCWRPVGALLAPYDEILIHVGIRDAA